MWSSPEIASASIFGERLESGQGKQEYAEVCGRPICGSRRQPQRANGTWWAHLGWIHHSGKSGSIRWWSTLTWSFRDALPSREAVAKWYHLRSVIYPWYRATLSIGTKSYNHTIRIYRSNGVGASAPTVRLPPKNFWTLPTCGVMHLSTTVVKPHRCGLLNPWDYQPRWLWIIGPRIQVSEEARRCIFLGGWKAAAHQLLDPWHQQANNNNG